MLPSQEEISSLSLDDFCQRIQEVKQVRSLSAIENAYINKGRRTIKNRLAAREVRHRQRCLIADLRENIEILEKGLDLSRHISFALLTTNQENERKIEALEKECLSLRISHTSYIDDQTTLSF